MSVHIELPIELRPLMKRPLGTLYRGKGRDTIEKFVGELASPTKLISVGDVTTFHLLEAGIIPDICIVDNRTKRKPVSRDVSDRNRDKVYEEVSVDNPAGIITDELIKTLCEAFASEKLLRIFVRGEEDLATLPVILLAPLGSVVLYGQPDEGVVFVRVTEKKKEEIRVLFEKLISKNQNTELDKIRRILDGHKDP
ncbi:GTP-dependent dephospho-CoA kinase family protein [Methanosarcina sp. T3]|uniref:GTP-dependent dephospho-CoA kinase family protein n=1 Tax=Methanosarcina sp. T3 TaxID=3439062 RepID=UPI003F831251